MERHDEVQCEQMEDYCRQLGLQLRDEQDNSTSIMTGDCTSQIPVLGHTQQAQNAGQNSQPIPPGHSKLEGTDKAYFECKKCEKNFANSRQFLKHRCVLKSNEETPAKTKSKKRGRKPKVKANEATERTNDEVSIRLEVHEKAQSAIFTSQKLPFFAIKKERETFHLIQVIPPPCNAHLFRKEGIPWFGMQLLTPPHISCTSPPHICHPVACSLKISRF